MKKTFTLFAFVLIAVCASAQDEPTLVWETEATYTNVPSSWGAGWAAIFENDYISDGTKIKVQKWSDNSIVILNWMATQDSDYDGYSDLKITYDGYTITSLSGNAESEYSSYFYTGYPGEIDYAYIYNTGSEMNSYNYFDPSDQGGYFYSMYCVYNNGAWGNWQSYYITWDVTETAINTPLSAKADTYKTAKYIYKNGQKFNYAGQRVK